MPFQQEGFGGGDLTAVFFARLRVRSGAQRGDGFVFAEAAAAAVLAAAPMQ